MVSKKNDQQFVKTLYGMCIMKKKFSFLIVFLALFIGHVGLVSKVHAVSELPTTQAAETQPSMDSPLKIEANCAPEAWCAFNDIEFHWSFAQPNNEKELPSVKEYRWVIDTVNPTTQQLKSIALDTGLSIKDHENGIFYFFVEALVEDDSVVQRQVYPFKIDAQPPAEFVPTVTDPIIELSQKTEVSFSSSDEHSGIDHYEARVNGGAWIKKESPLVVVGSEVGVYLFEIRAFDKAGNERTANTFIEVIEKLPKQEFETGNFVVNPEGKNKTLVPMLIVFVGLGMLAVIFLIKDRLSR